MMELRAWLLGLIDDLEDVGKVTESEMLGNVVGKIDEIIARKEAKNEQSKAKDNPTHTTTR